MGANVGTINLGLNVDYSSFNNQLLGIKNQAEGALTNSFKGLGKVVATAFSIRQITKFASSCINLASSLEEVQNVVDVTFGSEGSKVIENFSKNAMSSIGLSELKAKQYTSTLGAMYKSMGLSTNQALGMSMEMTKLAGDMASFYNLDHDVAFQKIRAGISGETEPLKQLGINMSVANLEAYAMSKGITTSYNKMSQANQALLRYNYLLDVTADAQGDFARTSDSWSNQVRILKLQFDSLKSTLGSAFIAVLTPVIRVINVLLGKLIQLANVFSSFISMLFGGGKSGKSSGGSLGKAASAASSTQTSLEGAGEAAKDVSSGLGGGASSAEKIKKALAGFDELNILNIKEEDTGGGGGGGDLGLDEELFEYPEETVFDTAADSIDKAREALEKFLAITGLDVFFQKIKDGFNSVNWSGIKDNLQSIADSMVPILQATADGLLTILRSFLSALGSLVAGAIGVIGDTIEFVTGGIAKFLEEQSPVITQWITETCNTIASGYDNIALIFDNLFGAWREAIAQNKDSLEEAISNMLTAISELYMTFGTIVADAFQITTQVISDFVASNKEKFVDFFSSFYEMWIEATNFIAGIISDISSIISDFWENYGKTIWKGLVSAITDIVGVLMDLWTGVVQPLFSYLIQAASDLWDSNLKPFLENLFSLLGEVGTFLVNLWNGVLKPIVDWVVQYAIPILKDMFSGLIDIVSNVIQYFYETFDGLITFLKGIFQVLNGILTGDWSLLWEGVKNIFSGAIQAITSLIGGFFELISSTLGRIAEFIGNTFVTLLQAAWDGVIGIFSWVWETITALLGSFIESFVTTISEFITSISTTISEAWSAAWTWISDTATNIWNNIVTFFSTFVTNLTEAISLFIEYLTTFIYETWQVLWQEFVNIVTNLWNSLTEIFNLFVQSIITGFQNIVSFLTETLQPIWTTVWTAIQTFTTALWAAIQTLAANFLNTIKTNFTNFLNSIKTAWSTAWNNVKTTVVTIWDNIKTTATTFINGVKTTLQNLISYISGAFVSAWRNAWNTVKNVFSQAWNSLVGIAKGAVNSVISALNGFIRALNRVHFSIPSWVPVLGGKSWGFNIAQIPMLAKGGIVDSPMIAQVGDNPRSAEVVAPLHELLPMIASSVAHAVTRAFNNKSSTAEEKPTQITVQLPENETVNAILNNIDKIALSDTLSPDAIVSGLKSSVGEVTSYVTGALSSEWNSAWSVVRSDCSQAWDTITSSSVNAWEAVKSASVQAWSTVRSDWAYAWETVKAGFVQAWNTIKNDISAAWSSITSTVRNAFSSLISAAGSFLSSADFSKISVQSGVSDSGSPSKGIDISQIPRLFNGGIVAAPMLAQVGDNTRSPEVVSPLHELLPMVASTVAHAVSEALRTTDRGLGQNQDKDLYLTIQIGGDDIVDTVIRGINRMTVRDGSSPIII